MTRITLRNLSTLAAMGKDEMKATTGGLILLPRPPICRILPWLPMCRRRPWPFPWLRAR